MPRIFRDLDKPTTFEEKCEKFMMISTMITAPILMILGVMAILVAMLKELGVLE